MYRKGFVLGTVAAAGSRTGSSVGCGVEAGFPPRRVSDVAVDCLPSSAGCNPIRVYDLERTLCDILRGSGSDVQIVGEAMKRYAASKDKNIHKLMQYADQLRVKPKVLRYMEVLL